LFLIAKNKKSTNKQFSRIIKKTLLKIFLIICFLVKISGELLNLSWKSLKVLKV